MRASGPCGGFSLIEVMCAILVLGVAVVGLTEGLTTALRSTKESEHQTAAALIAAGQVELVRAEGYVLKGETEGVIGEGAGAYRWRQIIEETRTEGLYEVRVVVESAKLGVAIYELRTLLFDPPISRAGSERGGESSRRRTGGTR